MACGVLGKVAIALAELELDFVDVFVWEPAIKKTAKVLILKRESVLSR